MNNFFFVDKKLYIYNKIKTAMKKETIILELRAAEGGEDSKLLVRDMAAMYIKAARNNNFVVTNEH
jgi:protein subunit release factor A